jgi:LAO/AO transport system kinase
MGRRGAEESRSITGAVLDVTAGRAAHGQAEPLAARSIRSETSHLGLLQRALAGDKVALSRLISAVESRSETGLSVLGEVYARTGRAHVIGLTGAPGSGKSTLVGRLARELRQRGLRVAVVAVDPSSPISGGAILADRIRMTQHSLDPGVFIRSMSSRGALGGLARATFDVVSVLDATGWDVVLVETVGVGQGEVEIAQLAQTTVVVSVPGLGDDIQAIKAGLLEIADIHVVNKIDRPDADQTIAELKAMLRLGPPKDAGAWGVPVIGTSAAAGTGLADLADTLDRHRAWQSNSPQREQRERAKAIARVRAIIKELVIERLQDPARASEFGAIIDALLGKELHPAAAAAHLLDHISVARQVAATKTAQAPD